MLLGNALYTYRGVFCVPKEFLSDQVAETAHLQLYLAVILLEDLLACVYHCAW